MKHLLISIGAVTLLVSSASAQIDTLHKAHKPSTSQSGWGDSVTPAGDLDGDGVTDIIVGSFGHGLSTAASVHSGASGDLLYELNTPFLPIWWSDGIVVIDDEDGDGVAEIVLVAAQSGDSNSPNGILRVYSGADGSLLRHVPVEAGVSIPGHSQGGSINLGDIDGDGSADILCRASSSLGTYLPCAISSSTGALIHAAIPSAGGTVTGDLVVSMDDHDGDGFADFAVPVIQDWRTRIDIFSAATGALIRELRPASGLPFMANGEPAISIADLDGDGLRDLAIGSGVLFSGRLLLISSADASELTDWSCDSASATCVGARVIEVPDISGDGHPDLISLGAPFTFSDPRNFFGLDPVSGEVLFEQSNPDGCATYSSAKRFISLPDVDGFGFPLLALSSCSLPEIHFQRVMPDIGTRVCASTPNSSGYPAVLDVHGTSSQGSDSLFLRVAHAAPSQALFFVYGSQAAQFPYGSGFLCVGGQVGRFPVQLLDSTGNATTQVDFGQLNPNHSSWTFQAIFRDTAGSGFSSSDAVTVELLP
ncbi:MAG: hypothetical protein ACI9HE_000695 [Planctomycetota bacterium]|jgi:hypothetical protein